MDKETWTLVGGENSVVDVAELRAQRGWSRVELARRARIHPSDITRIERGRMIPYRPQVRRLARVFRVSESKMFEGWKM